MAFNLKKWLEEAQAQVNVFDGGRTAQTVRASRPPAPPAQTVNKPRQAPQPTQKQQRLRTLGDQYRSGRINYNTFRRAVEGVSVGDQPSYVAERETRVSGPGGAIIKAATNRKVAPIALGIGRSAAGTAESLSGLYDAVTPGRGNSRFTKSARRAGEITDATVKQNNYNSLAYKGGQLFGDVATFTAPGSLLKTSSKVPRIVQKATAPITTNLVGRGTAGAIRYASKPSSLVNIGVGTAQNTGYRSARGEDISPGTIAIDAGLNAGFGLGVDVAGRGIQATTKLVSQNAPKVAKAVGPQIDPALLRERNKYVVSRANAKGKDPGLIEYLDRKISDIDNRIAMQREGGYIAMGGDGKQFVNVTKDQRIFDGQAPEKYPAIARNYLEQNFKGKVVQLGKDGQITFTSKGNKKFAAPNQKLEQNLLNAKFRLTPELDNAALISKKVGHKADTKGKLGSFSKDGFDYRSFEFEVGGQRFRGIINVAKNGKIQNFYDVYPIKKSPVWGDSPSGFPQGGTVSPNGAPTSNIPQNAKIVNSPTLQDALEGKSTKLQKSTTAVMTKPAKPATKVRVAEPPLPPAKTGVQTMAPPPDNPRMGTKQLPSGKTKKTKFADKTVPESQYVSERVKGSIKSPEYSPQTEKQGYTSALSRLKQEGDEVFESNVNKALNKEKGTITRQEAIDATTAAQLLDSKGDELSTQRATDIYEKLSEHYAAAGQTIQVAAILSRRTPEGMRGWATSQLTKGGAKLTPQLQKQIVELSQAKKFTELADLVSKNIPSTMGDKIINFWRAGLLTAPTTTGGNILGNTGETLVRKGFVNPTATLADALMGKFTGKRTMTLAKGGEFEKGLAKGAKEFGKGDTSKYDVDKRTNYKTKALDKYVNGVYRLMGVADTPFNRGAEREALSSIAKAEAINQKLKGEARDKFIKDFMDNPPESALQRAQKEADYATFKNPTTLGNVASGLKRSAGKYKPVADFVIPFTQVPAAIATRLVERTPIGVAKEIVDQVRAVKSGQPFDQRSMAQAIGNGSFGLVAIGAGMTLAKSDLLTFGYPSDAKERALWEEEGKQPYSVRIGDRWYSMNYLQPFGMLMAIGGQAERDIKDGKDSSEAVANAVGAAGRAIQEQSFLKGINGFLTLLSDPEQSAQKYVEQTTSSTVPNVVRSFARAGDELQRAPEGVVEGVKSGIPGLRETTTPKTSKITGKPLPAKDTFANQYFNPLKPSKVRSSELTAELRRLQDAKEGILPTEANKSVYGKQEISKKQLNELNNTVRQGINIGWQQAVQDPRYKSLSDQDRRAVLQDISNTVGGGVKAVYAAKNNFINDTWEPKLNSRQRALLQGEDVDFFAKYDKSEDTKTASKTKTSKAKSSKKTSKSSGRGRNGRRGSLDYKLFAYGKPESTNTSLRALLKKVQMS